MPFGLKNTPTIFPRVVVVAFKEYIHKFLEVYLDYWTVFGHVVCKQGLIVDPAKVVVILNLKVPRSVKQLCATLGHTCYYRKFIKSYAQIIAPMETLLKKDATYCLNDDCRKSLDVLKEKMASAPIMVFPEWDIEFHVHVDASCIALEAVLTQEGVEGMDHLIPFASRRLSKA
eukprot:PITA_36150